MYSRSRPAALLLVALTAGLALAGCGGGDAVEVSGPPPPTFARGEVPSATLDDLRLKLSSISQDECLRDDPARIYPTCGRFLSELQASLPAVRELAPGATKAADTADGAAQRVVRAGCVNAPNSGPAGAPNVCGPALAVLQDDVRALVAAVGR